MSRQDIAISVQGLLTQFGQSVIHQDLNLDVRQGEVLGIVGGSGSGKSVLLNTIIGLRRPDAGRIEVLGRAIDAESKEADLLEVKRRCGVLFQDGALFSTLTVQQNIEVPLATHTDISPALRRELAAVKIKLVGLPADAAHKYPSELSGGMRKRAGLARALSLDPMILFLDEPTAGLDPIGAADFDALIEELVSALGLTVVMITHDLDSLFRICDRVCVLIHKQVTLGTLEELMGSDDPWIREYFRGPRGRAAVETSKRTDTGAHADAGKPTAGGGNPGDESGGFASPAPESAATVSSQDKH